jgi:hypothetical protein
LRHDVSLEQWGVGLADDALTDMALTAPLTWGYVCSPFKSGRWGYLVRGTLHVRGWNTVSENPRYCECEMDAQA